MKTPEESKAECQAALNRLCKWRTVLAGWQLGTRAKGDPECSAVSDHRDATLILRAEVTALLAMLLKHNIFTEQEFRDQLTEEADYYSKLIEKKFPGFKATDSGIDIDVKIAAQTTKGWKP